MQAFLRFCCGNLSRNKLNGAGQFLKIVYNIVRVSTVVLVIALIGFEKHCFHTRIMSAVDIAVHIVTYVDNFRGIQLHDFERFFKKPRIRFTVSIIAGNNDRIKKMLQTDRLEFRSRPEALPIGYCSQLIVALEVFEYIVNAVVALKLVSARSAEYH